MNRADSHESGSSSPSTAQEGSILSSTSLADVVNGSLYQQAHRSDSNLLVKLSARLIPIWPRVICASVISGHYVKELVANGQSPSAGPAPQPLRAFPNFAAQQAPQSRTAPLGSGRLQSANKLGMHDQSNFWRQWLFNLNLYGFLGNGPTWGYPAANGGQGLPTPQSRPPGSTTNTSFAQSIGGSQPATPLDLSEFPSLSGAPQPHYQNPGQAVWANANQRAVQHTPVQRPQQQPSINQQAPNQQPQQTQQNQDHSQQSREDIFSASSQFHGGNDDYHQGGQGGVGQLGGANQPQPSSIEDFPPLGRNGTDESQQDRRGSLMQSAAFGGFPSSGTFPLPPGQNQGRHGLPSVLGGQSETSRSSTLVDRTMSPSTLGFGGASSTARSPAESTRQGHAGLSDQEKSNLTTPRSTQQSNINSLLSSLHESQMGHPSHSSRGPPGAPGQQHGFDRLGASQTADQTPLDQMVSIDRWGLAGLLATIRSDNPDASGLAIGQDLTQLGLDLNSPEPLWPTWTGPFADAGARPLQPEFHLPDCYTVDNVHRVKDKIPSFADETLFWIFYTQPRDIMQELAAVELTNRNWRYHKELMMWLTKDVSMGEPIQISETAEKGSYVFFNHRTWQRARSEFVLSYDLLDNHISVNGQGGGM
ncbi:MAG: hypothetical protein Q9190_005538 [Brigantiaea leucoxantha]